MAKEILNDDVEKLLIANHNPETLFVGKDDFQTIFAIYRAINRDEKGAFVLVMNTKIRCKVDPPAAEVDLSEKLIWEN